MFSRFNLLPSLSVRNRIDTVVGRPIQLFQQFQTPLTTRGSELEFNNSHNTTTVRNFKSISWRQRSIAIKKRLRQAEQRYRKPGRIQAASMPLSPQEMDNTVLLVLSQMDHHGAQIEVLKRHVMERDKIGVFIALSSGALSLPLVFHHPTAHWFNNNFVTCVVPEPHELETVLEIGAWTWNWMEPPLGTISFVLLTFQVARSNMQNIGSKPYTARVKQWRAEQLAAAFPQYDASILIQYSNNTSLQESKVEIENA